MNKNQILENSTTYNISYGFTGGDKVRYGKLMVLNTTEQYDKFWEAVDKDANWTLDLRKTYIYVVDGEKFKIDNLFEDEDSTFRVFEILNDE